MTLVRDAHRWLDELTTSPNLNIGSLAAREGKTERWIRLTISPAFLCPARTSWWSYQIHETGYHAPWLTEVMGFDLDARHQAHQILLNKVDL
jgi:hypothetical protein